MDPLPRLRFSGAEDRPIRSADDGIELPLWLREASTTYRLALVMLPDDAEALLAAAFDFAFQLHEGQFRASGDPIVHPVAVADLLRDIGASASGLLRAFCTRGGRHRCHAGTVGKPLWP